MKREELKELGLTDEQIESVMAKSGAEVAALNTQITTLKSEKSQLENDKNVLKQEKEDKEKAFNDLQKKSISQEDYNAKVKEIEENAKKSHEEYVLNQLLDQALNEAKVLNTENSRKSVKCLLDMEKVSISKDQKALIGVKEQLDAIKKTDGYFFEKTVKGHSPAGGTGNDDDKDEEDSSNVSSVSDIAKELNSQNAGTETKSQFFN